MTQIVANGIALEFETRGDRSGVPIILVRGLGTQLIDWPDSLLDGLVASGFYVVIFDNRDVGLSEKFAGKPDVTAVFKGEEIPPYTIEDMADDVVGLMDSLAIDRAHLFAISMGGMIGQVVAARHGDRILSFFSVMSSTSRPGLPRATPEAAATLVPDPAEGEAGVIQSISEGLRICGSPGYPTSEEDRIAIATRRVQRDFTPDGEIRQMAAIAALGSRVELLAGIKVPVLVIHGADDPLMPLTSGEDTAACIPGAQLKVIPGMGHDLPEALMPEMVNIIADFCAALEV
jgi:pimeloyl-ACP methyl ester carboxylesterase